ncbi:MAG: hypothetical protein V2I25_09785 [Woeseiaceae bacterium]|jgi:hypothetical protein|nr:hypothetical protein [Woeseiaceae bacterium]
MTDEPRETDEHDAGEVPGALALSRAENHIVRLTFWQTILSVVGILVALLALYAALNESAAVRQQTAAAVWPFVQLTIDDFDTGDAAGFSIGFTNAGVGPAKVGDVLVSIDGKPAPDWRTFIGLVGGDADAMVSRNWISDRVLRPDETVELIATMDVPLARRLVTAIREPGNHIVFCYCSIFDDCWLADSRKDLQAPEPVEMCPDYGDAAYRN